MNLYHELTIGEYFLLEIGNHANHAAEKESPPGDLMTTWFENKMLWFGRLPPLIHDFRDIRVQNLGQNIIMNTNRDKKLHLSHGSANLVL